MLFRSYCCSIFQLCITFVIQAATFSQNLNAGQYLKAKGLPLHQQMPPWSRAALPLAGSLVKPEPWAASSIPTKLHDWPVSPLTVVSFGIVPSTAKPHRSGKPPRKPAPAAPPGHCASPAALLSHPAGSPGAERKWLLPAFSKRARLLASSSLPEARR